MTGCKLRGADGGTRVTSLGGWDPESNLGGIETQIDELLGMTTIQDSQVAGLGKQDEAVQDPGLYQAIQERGLQDNGCC